MKRPGCVRELDRIQHKENTHKSLILQLLIKSQFFFRCWLFLVNNFVHKMKASIPRLRYIRAKITTSLLRTTATCTEQATHCCHSSRLYISHCYFCPPHATIVNYARYSWLEIKPRCRCDGIHTVSRFYVFSSSGVKSLKTASKAVLWTRLTNCRIISVGKLNVKKWEISWTFMPS